MPAVRSAVAVLILFVGTAVSGGTIVVTGTGDSGPGSLRAAIQATNSGACSSPCDIVFNIAGTPGPGGVFTIAPLTMLDSVFSGTAVIDGATQTAFSGDTNPAGPEIVISGANACIADTQCRGLGTGTASVFRNLVLNGWTNRNNEFNAGRGVAISLGSMDAIAAEVTDNYIGTDPTGMFAVPNDRGLDTRAYGPLIARNVIGGNIDYGIFGQRGLIGANLGANTIVGNYIGTTRNGNAPLPNGMGIQVIGSVQPVNIAIGGILPGQGNIIAYNLAEGIWLKAGPGCNNTIRGNSIHSNGGQGIADTGPGFPPLSPQCSVERFPPQLETLTYNSGTGQSTVTGGFYGNADVALTLDWYTNSEPDPSGFGEGETYIATRNVTTDSTGHWSVQLPGDLRNSNLVATTTQSSFSNVIGSAADLRLTMTESHTNLVGHGTRLRYTITVDNLGPDEATHVVVVDRRPQGVDAFGAIAGPEWSCTNSVNEVRCTLVQPLPVGASRSFVVEGNVQVADTTVTNTATVTAAEQDTNPANNSASVTTTVRPFLVDLFVEHQVAPPAGEVSSLIPYSLRIANDGPDDEPAVTLTISLAEGLVAESIVLVDGTMNCTGTNPKTCTVGPIAGNAQRVVLLDLRAPATPGFVSHAVTVSGLRNDPDLNDNTSTADTRLTPKQGRRRSARK